MTKDIFLTSKLLNPFNLPQQDKPGHQIMFGTPRYGKSIIIEELAKNNPNIVILDVSEKEQKEHQEERKLEQEADAKRLLAVKETFWSHTKDDAQTIDSLKYILLETFNFGETEPSLEQLKAFFMSFDDYIIGQIISWGIDDTEVRQSIYEYSNEIQEQLMSEIFG
ncbi:hypothetical protein [Acinetobacter beijerinckii]|uniref:Uncharacterized protein n=1 Tax=Acinetobacter beijerinckii CIP 110307 TaxID=1217648 RepID=N9FDP1_9GAMM|nr:hypothetical protein [Acinetobacter beijerinckii]ENW02986.1 hypothetical protein F933_03392 [Acinetobacter beijerinckii CIP 110307]